MTAAVELGAQLEAVRDPAAVVDKEGVLERANAAFLTVGLDGSVDGRTLSVFLGAAAAQMRSALLRAADGRFAESHAYVEKNGVMRGYRIVFLPQPGGRALLLLTESQHDLAYVDMTTGLPNRRNANARLEQEWYRKLRGSRTEFCLAFADLDHFKLVNDRYGHDVGDEILRLVAISINSNLRRGDWCARWSGEEFLIFFHDVDIAGGIIGGERIRRYLSANPRVISSKIKIPVTLSAGLVCSKDYSANDMRRMFLDADILLYEAKHTGRNRIHARQTDEHAFWESGEITEMLRSGKLLARLIPVTRGLGGEHVGLLCLAGIAGRDNIAARRMLRSARAQDMLTEVEIRLLDKLLAVLGDKESTELFVPFSAGSLRRYGDDNSMASGVRALVRAGHRPVVLASAQQFQVEPPRELTAMLKADGVRFGLRDVNLENFPTRLLSELSPSHVMVARSASDSRPLAEYMGRTLAGSGTTLITPPDIADHVRQVCSNVLVVPETDLF